MRKLAALPAENVVALPVAEFRTKVFIYQEIFAFFHQTKLFSALIISLLFHPAMIELADHVIILVSHPAINA